MLEQLKPANAPSSKDNQNALLMFLNEELKDKRYLLVLDDVWNEDSGKWENLMDCLSKLHSAKGSKIIVTTRKGKVASISEKLIPRHELGKLSVDECWSIMKDRAFPNSNAHIDPQFQTIGREIAENCGGIPLVAKVLGGVLHTKKSMKEWSSFKNSRIWDNLSKGEDIVMPVLRLSFDNLESPSLKQCFAYCSMFEKDVEFQRENSIQLWMAQGLLRHSHDESKDMEDIGNEYFDILLQSSLFQDATMSDNGIVSKCKMHDLVHDLAEHVSKSDSLTRDLGGIDNTLEIRHAARVSTFELGKFPKRSAGKLRSLISDNGEVPINILPRFKALRILNLSNAYIEEFPISVGRLKHLRYLDISETRFKVLPKSVGKLYNLQTLRATNCALKEFPKELQNLINLRHIYFDKNIKFPKGISRLNCLRTLPYFSVGNEIGRQIEELAGLKQLKGQLIIWNLEHVKNREEAKKAKLEDKTKVCHLEFKWTSDRSTTDNNEEEDVLEGLRPHCDLESLSIENFMGNKFPLWMMSGSLQLNNLKKIELLRCDKCEVVPPLGHLPNLTKLEIRGMANLKCVGAEFYGHGVVHNVATTSKGTITLFPALKVLYICNCGDLIEWLEAPLMSTIMVFPCLERLYIYDCKKLRHLAYRLDTLPLLEELSIVECPSLELIPIEQGMASLRRLCIIDCGRLSHLPSGLKNCTSLQELRIEKCDGLSGPLSLGASLVEVSIRYCNGLSGPLSVCASLVELSIWSCDNLTSIEIKSSGSLTASLQKLTINFCNELTSLPALPQQCPSLQELEISECPKLSSFGVKSRRVEEEGEECISLRQLWIWSCPKLASFCAQSTSDLHTMTSLRILRISNCERLESWVSSLQFPLSLKKLVMFRIPNLEILPSLDNLNSLRDLAIGPFWQELGSFPFPDFEVGSLMHLTRLEVYGWPKLKSLPQQIQHLTSLTDLYISSFEGLETLPEWLGSLTSLTYLRIEDCKNLMNLPEWLGSLSSLTELKIYDCKNLMNLPSVQAMQRLTKLQTLWIYGCHPLLEQRCTKDSGIDWLKISHIPNITIVV